MPPSFSERARRYLLGDLPDADAMALEDQYFGDAEALEQVQAVETELVDDHAAGRLTPEERRRFDAHYLASPGHRQRAAIARALQRRTGGVPVVVPPRRNRSPTVYLALAASLLIALAAFWLLQPPPPGERLAGTPSSTPTSVITLPSAGPSPAVEGPRPSVGNGRGSPVVAAFAISPILVRGGREQARLRIPPGADEVLLHLEGEAVPERLTFSLRTVEGVAVTSGRAHPAAAAAAPPERVATVRVPAARLPPGDYILTLTAQDSADLHQYFFRVLPR